MRTFRELLALHGTSDKDREHSYGEVYDRLLAPIRESARCVIELGIGPRGGAMRAWRDYFPNATIVGVDDDPAKLIVGEERIVSVLGSVCESADHPSVSLLCGALERVVPPEGADVIVDDGPHRAAQQMGCLAVLQRFLRPGGLYFVEDALAVMELMGLEPRFPRLVGCHDLRGVKGRTDDVLYCWTKEPR